MNSMTPSISRPTRDWARRCSPSSSRRSSAAVWLDTCRGAVSAPVLEEDVEPGREAAARRYLRVDLAQRAGTAVARVGVERQSGLLALGVDARELGLGHEDLAARLER